MKKVAFVLLLACVIMGTAFAQAKPATPAPAPAPAAASAPKTGRANAIGGDVFQLFKGFITSDSDSNPEVSTFDLVLSYERLISPHFSIGGDMDIYIISFDYGLVTVDGNNIKLYHHKLELGSGRVRVSYIPQYKL